MWIPSFHLTCLLYSGFYFLSLDIPVTVISVFPVGSTNFFTIGLCLAWDTSMLSIFCAWSTYVIFTITSFVLTLKESVDLVMCRISTR